MALDSLSIYRSKRNFDITSEPKEGGEPNVEARSFVIQKHWASHLHYDFRLELDGTMKSWAVPKGPSFDSKDKRMAVHVEDHPISYNTFEGTIPEKQYGAGKVIIWDKGTWIPLGDPREGYRNGNLKFELRGHKLRGKWVLVRMKGKGEKQEPWLLIKEKDAFMRPATEYSVVDELPDSVAALPMPDGAQPANDKSAAANTGNGKRGASTRKAAANVSAKPARKQRGTASSDAAVHPHAGPPAGAVPSTLPDSLSPQLATLVDAPPADTENWLYEIKFDGYRIVARIDSGEVRLVTRNGHDWTARLPALAQALASMQLPSCWLDGEIVVADENGLPDFQALQNAFDTARTQNIAYYVFDLPYCADHDLRQVPLIERRRILQMVLQRSPSDLVRYSDSFDASVQDLLASSCRIGLEGLIGKRKDSPYVTRRSRDWIKLKCAQRQEFVIGGFTDPKGSRKGIGSLLLGVHDQEGNLLYAGNVGTGFSERTLAELRRQLDAIGSDKNPFSSETDTGKAHWVKPALMAEVSFGEWTNTGRIRHSVFHGLRTDKKARSIVREQATHVNGKSGAGTHSNANSKAQSRSAAANHPDLPGTLPKDFKVTHGERVVDAQSGLTKIDLIRYYALVAPLMMEHLKGRPVSLVRAPEGIGGQLFFQKHMEHKLDGIALLDPALDPDHASLMEVAKPLGLLSAAQMNVVEFHTWNAVKTAIGTPDRMTFDLDPGEGVEWPLMQEATLLMKSFLEQLGLKSFAKTSGGKGMHVIVPLKQQYDWDTVKDFSKAIVEHMANTLPMRFVAKSGPKNRVGKIFIDYLRNGFGATTVSAWSIRSRPGLGVSVPVGWDEIEKLHGSAQWHVANIHTRLDQGNAPWQDYAKSAQSLTAAMRMLGFVPVKQK
ncbi:DNA ligase D [Oxalicibacterium flavum]|nr:DNA ligase D [Oxalicibacterium flavum]